MKTTKKENIYKSATIEENNASKEQKLEKSFLSELLLSLKSGMFAFAIVFSFSIISKSNAFSTGAAEIFNVTIYDVLFSFWAFLIFSFTVFVSKNNLPKE